MTSIYLTALVGLRWSLGWPIIIYISKQEGVGI